MMIQEFIERTGYKPTNEEYHYIEESYYEADTVSKDEFCKQWKKDQKSGKWAMELKFRMALDAQKAEYEAKIAEQEENLNFYRAEFPKTRDAITRLKETVCEQNEKLEAAKRRTERLAALFED